MKTPIIKYSDKFLDRVGLFMRIGGITLWPFIILREIYDASPPWRRKAARIINHESIHIKQQEEMLILPFYVWYVLEWFIKLFFYGKKAYYNISFEREAYDNDDNLSYLNSRKRYSWLKRLFK
tara:strand:+ start:276 stop:644 length:369 start_codon:yes stop_codon:yes gene_type:complete